MNNSKKILSLLAILSLGSTSLSADSNIDSSSLVKRYLDSKIYDLQSDPLFPEWLKRTEF